MSGNSRVRQVTSALLGFQPGDRVVVFQDTKSAILFNSFKIDPRELHGIVVEGTRPDEPRLRVSMGVWGHLWWIHADDMRLDDE